jgi:hypothetical protein
LIVTDETIILIVTIRHGLHTFLYTHHFKLSVKETTLISLSSSTAQKFMAKYCFWKDCHSLSHHYRIALFLYNLFPQHSQNMSNLQAYSFSPI